MIGKSLRERNTLAPLPAETAEALLKERLAQDAAALVEVRARDPRMVACLFVRANKVAVRVCRALGLRMTLGGSGVLGLLGSDAARFFDQLPEPKRAWLETPCGPRETKVLLVAEGIALLSIEAKDGKTLVSAVG
ncbi:MAG TPA: hypothetical protein VGI39_11965 [Polyangiaceae bacterium]